MVLSTPERQRREAAPVHLVADEAMSYSFGEEDPITKKGWRKRAVPLFGCEGDGLSLAPNSAYQTDSLQAILKLISL